MGEQYSHTLIAVPKDFKPSGIQIERFLTAMAIQNVVHGIPTVTLRIPTGKTREYPYLDPFTGKNLIVELRDKKKLPGFTDLANTVEALPDFEIEVAGFGSPKSPPVFVDFHEPFHVGITCFIYSQLRSTSDSHEPAISGQPIIGYRKTFTGTETDGYFHNPHTMEIIKVPDAGCSRFWIQFELGKFLCPAINDSLDLLNPAIVREAENIFGIPFVQGCYWG